MIYTNKISKRLLKSELVKRGISSSTLVELLAQIGINETKSSIESKISRGTFSASFFLNCLTVIGCSNIILEYNLYSNNLVTEQLSKYGENKNE